MARELKEFYLEYYSYARKCKTSEGFSKPNHLGSSQYLQNATDQQHPQTTILQASKKVVRKADDDEYNEDELE